MQATEQDAATRVEASTGEDLRRCWTLSGSTRATLAKARSARIARWLFVGLATLYGVRLLGNEGNPSALRDGLSSLSWPLLISLPALFASNDVERGALDKLGLLHGLSPKQCALAHALARVLLLAIPLVGSSLVLWLCFSISAGSIVGLLLLVLGLVACLLVQLACASLLTALAALCEQLSPRRPQRMLWGFVLVPLLLHSVVPELPSAWHGYREWVTWSVSLGTPS